MTTLFIATRNLHKAAEIRAILGAAFQYFTLADFPSAPPVIEDADTFEGNASLKAVALARWIAEAARFTYHASRINFVLADDSGLEVDALNGAPGVHSARFARSQEGLDARLAGNSPDSENNAKLLRLLQDAPIEKRTARFRCVLALVPVPAPRIETASPVCYADEFAASFFDGTCEGRIQFAASGGGGFGYDPLFVPEGHAQSFAELGEELKNKMSHRAKAIGKLRVFFNLA